jgi:uncharacterized protein (TIGR02453 family)
MKIIVDFLDRLMRNNDREWFADHKAEYVAVQNRFNGYVEQLITEIGKFDKSVQKLQVKDCIYRIYKDMRYSTNKLPYKTHMGGYICPHGKKSGYAGYYFHLEPAESEYLNGCLLASGCYNPDNKLLTRFRDHIMANGTHFEQLVQSAPHFTLSNNAKLSRVPNGYPKDSPYAEYLKLKDFSLMMPLSDDLVYGPNVIKEVVELFRETQTYNAVLNGIIEEHQTEWI